MVNTKRNYLDSNSKKKITPFLSDNLQQKLETDLQSTQRGLSRPRTPFMSAFCNEYRSIFEDEFQKFCEEQYLQSNLESIEEFANMTQTELLVLLGNTYNPKDFDFDEDKVLLMIFVNAFFFIVVFVVVVFLNYIQNMQILTT
jgi:hypothetical protein